MQLRNLAEKTHPPSCIAPREELQSLSVVLKGRSVGEQAGAFISSLLGVPQTAYAFSPLGKVVGQLFEGFLFRGADGLLQKLPRHEVQSGAIRSQAPIDEIPSSNMRKGDLLLPSVLSPAQETPMVKG
jgi:hypothetical protein